MASVGLRAAGPAVRAFELTARFVRVGADVNRTPDALHAPDRPGPGKALRPHASDPPPFQGGRGNRAPADDHGRQGPLWCPGPDPAPRRSAGGVSGGTARWAPAFGPAPERDRPGHRRQWPSSPQRFDIMRGAGGMPSVLGKTLPGRDRPRSTRVSWLAVVPRARGAPRRRYPHQRVGARISRRHPPADPWPQDIRRRPPVQDGWVEQGRSVPGDGAELRAPCAEFHPRAAVGTAPASPAGPRMGARRCRSGRDGASRRWAIPWCGPGR